MGWNIPVNGGKLVKDFPTLDAVRNGLDKILVTMADGTGEKTLTLAVLKAFFTQDIDRALGDTTALSTEEKANLVLAINEIVAQAVKDRQTAQQLEKKVTGIDALTAFLTRKGASRANSLITEYSLGTAYTDDLSADIKSGDFEKVRTGAYITLNGRKYWAGGADYRLHCGDTELTPHHMLWVPDKSFYTSAWNASNDTSGGYANSKIQKEGLASALETIKKDFGAAHILPCRLLLGNAVSNGSTSGWAWFDSQVDLMNEHMVYGARAWGGGAHVGYDVGCDKTQLPLFQARPDLITNRENWWLRDVWSASDACSVNVNGRASYWGASSVIGVRPAFLTY